MAVWFFIVERCL